MRRTEPLSAIALEVLLRRIDCGDWNAQTIIHVTRRVELNDCARGGPRAHRDIIRATGWIAVARGVLGDDRHVPGDHWCVVAVGDAGKPEQQKRHAQTVTGAEY